MQFAHHQLFDPRFPPGGTLPLTGCWTDDEEGRLIQGKSWTRVEIQGKELGSFPLTRVGRSDTLLLSVLAQLDFSKERSLTHLNGIEDNELFSSD